MTQIQLYEMRSYRVADGRMADELERGLACMLTPAEGGRGLFDRYGIPRPVGLWRVLSGPTLPSVIFLYRWNSVAERAQAFETFYDDPDWNALRVGSNEGSEIVSNMDDVLLRGPAPEAVPLDGTYEFVRGSALPHGKTVIGPLAPLCGNDPSDLRVLLHEGNVEGPFDESRILCRNVALSTSR
jgi:hypothetical protein